MPQITRIPKKEIYLKLLKMEKDIKELKELLEGPKKKPRQRVSLRGILGKIKVNERDFEEAKRSLFPSIKRG
jgi:hypothetical protein